MKISGPPRNFIFERKTKHNIRIKFNSLYHNREIYFARDVNIDQRSSSIKNLETVEMCHRYYIHSDNLSHTIHSDKLSWFKISTTQ